MTNNKSKTYYRSYLLRLWSGRGLNSRNWRASLENPQTGERLGFANLERLFAFLQDQTENMTYDNDTAMSSEEEEL